MIYLQCVIFAINFNVFVQKLNANRMETIFVELIRDESVHKATLAHSAVTCEHKRETGSQFNNSICVIATVDNNFAVNICATEQLFWENIQRVK